MEMLMRIVPFWIHLRIQMYRVIEFIEFSTNQKKHYTPEN